MGTLFQDDGGLGRFQNLAVLGRSPQDFRDRAAQCRDLAQSCLTNDAETILRDLADDLDREAAKLETSGRKKVFAAV